MKSVTTTNAVTVSFKLSHPRSPFKSWNIKVRKKARAWRAPEASKAVKWPLKRFGLIGWEFEKGKDRKHSTVGHGRSLYSMNQLLTKIVTKSSVTARGCLERHCAEGNGAERAR
jgi:hypothetical protein